MSQKKSSRPPSRRDVYIKYKTIANNSKHRSGILERYTYKTDAGVLLSAAPEKSSDKHISRLPYPSISISRERLEDSGRSSVLEAKKRKTNTEPNISIYKVGNVNRTDKTAVRTETCDSTTDIIEFLDRKQIEILRALSDDAHTINIDSDSDCEIVELKDVDSKSDISILSADTVIHEPQPVCDPPDSPRAEPVPNTVFKPDPEILVISDSDEEEPCQQEPEDTKQNCPVLDKDLVTFLCERTGLRKVVSQSSAARGSLSVCTEKIRDAPVLGARTAYVKETAATSATYIKSTTSPLSTEKCVDYKESVEMINEKYFVVKNKLNSLKTGSPVKTASTTVRPPEYLLHSPKREPSSPPTYIPTQKTQEVQSPETMKTEFYKYLKINTNPSAQKIAAVTQNRRSNRVKNLILQMEKAKELDTIRNEYDKPSTSRLSAEKDIRKEYMKYTKPKLVFPALPLEHNKPKDFNESFGEYVRQEEIDIGALMTTRSKQVRPAVSVRRQQTAAQPTKAREQKGAMAKKKKLTKAGQRKPRARKVVSVKNPTHFPEKSRRKRLGINRALRNAVSRATSLKAASSKSIKARKNKPHGVLSVTAADTAITDPEPDVTRPAENTVIEDAKSTSAEVEPVTEPASDLHVQMEPVSPVDDSDMLLPNILAKKLCEALQKHTQDAHGIMKRKTMFGPKTVEASNMTAAVCVPPVCETECLVGSFAAKIDERKRVPSTHIETMQKAPETAQSSMSQPGSDQSANHAKDLGSAGGNNRPTKVIFITRSTDPGSANSSTATFVGFTTLQESICDPPASGHRPEKKDCLGFSADADSARINKKMQDIVAALSKIDSLNTNSQCKNRKKRSKTPAVVPDIIITEPSDVENSPATPDSEHAGGHGDEFMAPASNVVQSVTIRSGNPDYIPLNRDMKIKSLHSSLLHASSKCKANVKAGLFDLSDTDTTMTSPKTPKGTPIKKHTTHEIDINRNDGAVFNAYYVDDILIIVQVKIITFWKQTALGNILGVQNMWLPRGNLQRIILDPGCVNRRSSEMIMSVDNAIAYIELWTKEHKCYYRECPIADVFATIYFQRGNGAPDKKVIQLENIKGYGDDVRFAVVKGSREIIVSWCDTYSKPMKSIIRSYQLAPDFQTVASVKEMESVPHYISSIHNIHDSDNLILGAGNDQISLWNLKHGYLVMTLNMADGPIQPLVRSNTICLYAQCNTTFLFLIQQTEVGVLRLVAVNGMTHEWKQLHSFKVPETYNKLLGVIVESGVLMTCYTNGFLSWNMHTGEILSEIDTGNEHIVLPSNKYLVAIDNYQVNVQHIMAYILTHDW